MTQWKTKIEHYDIDTGDQISWRDQKNYITIKKEKDASIQNGHGTITYRYHCKKVYNGDLFNTNEQTVQRERNNNKR